MLKKLGLVGSWVIYNRMNVRTFEVQDSKLLINSAHQTIDENIVGMLAVCDMLQLV